MRTIFNTYVELKSKAMYDRLVKAVKEKLLRVYTDYGYDGSEKYFYNNLIVDGFDCWLTSVGKKVTEQEFLELLKEYKP